MHKKKASLVPLINEEDLPSDDQQVVGSPMKSVNSASSPSLLLSGDSDTNQYFVSPQKLLTRRSQRIQTHLYVYFVQFVSNVSHVGELRSVVVLNWNGFTSYLQVRGEELA